MLYEDNPNRNKMHCQIKTGVPWTPVFYLIGRTIFLYVHNIYFMRNKSYP